MINYIAFFIIFTPLFGIILMELGGYGSSIGRYGYFNGASLGYFIHATIIVVISFIVAKLKIKNPKNDLIRDKKYRNYFLLSILGFTINFILLIIILFGYGGIDVVLGEIGKGEFRVTLGYFGSFAYIISKYISPSILAYLTFLYCNSKPKKHKNLLIFNFVIVFLIGTCWGFKTTGIFMILPSLLLIYWRIKFRQFLFFGLMATLIMIFFFTIFDRTNESLPEIVGRLYTRATIIQGDVSWDIWDKYKNNIDFPPYYKTLYPIVGDKIFVNLFGTSKEEYLDWVHYHYDLMLTYIIGYPLEGIKGGHSVTGTTFSEGIIAFGVPLYTIFSFISGIILGLNILIIKISINYNKPIIYSISSTYFCFITLSWLNGGAIIQLFHISVIFGILLSLCVLAYISAVERLKPIA